MRRMPLNAGELDKFIILSGKFNFTDETIEHVLEDELYGKLATEILECGKKGIRKGAIIEDVEYGGCYVGEILDDGTATLISTNISGATSVDLQIDKSDENNIKLVVLTAYNQFLTNADAPKMYVHHLVINVINYFTIYSSNNLEANTPEKLTTLLKDENKDIYYFGFRQTQYIDGAALQFNGSTNLWEVRAGGEESSSAITNINDIVTPI